MIAATSEMTGSETDRSGSVEQVGALVTPFDELYAIPPTRGQERFWSLDQMNPGNPALNMPLMWRCTGPLNLELLREAFSLVVVRHESLRTTFGLVNGQLMQIIGAPWQVAVPLVDLSHTAEGEQSSQAKQLINDHAAIRMNLHSGPLMVTKLLRFGPTEHMLLVTLHHIICDGVSTGILLRDMTAKYESLQGGESDPLPELPIQFADYALWQEDWRKTAEYAAALDFWRRSLGSDFTRIEIGSKVSPDRASRARVKKDAGDIETLLLEEKLAVRVHEFCNANYITYNVFFFTVFSMWLSRISGQTDLLIGSPSANRVPQTEDLIGNLMNIQAIRVKLKEDDTFKTLAGRISEWNLQAYENRRVPFEDLIYDQHFSSGNSSLELPVFFLYQKSFMVTRTVGDLTFTPLRSMSPGAAFEVMFAVVDRIGEGPRLQLEFNPLKFKAETIRQYLATYVDLVESALNRPDALVIDSGGLGEPVVDGRGAEPRNSQALRVSDGRSEKHSSGESRTYRDPIEFQLVEIWQSTLGIPYISLDDGFFSLGVSSLSALRLVNKMNRSYSTSLGLASLFSASTIRAIAVLIRDRLSPNMHSSLVPIQPLGTKRPLFVIHGIRGNVLSFYGLVAHLGKDQPLYGIQAQALVTGEPALLRFEDMARYYVAEMRKVQPEGPYRLLGYSFGGIMVMEMAHQLKAAGQEVGLLGMLDSKSPDYMQELLKWRSVPNKGALEEQQVAREPAEMTGPEKVREVIGRVRARVIRACCQLASLANIRTVPSFMKDAWSINYVANSRYVPRIYEGRMTLFRATRQAVQNVSADLGWGRFFTDGVDVRELPGTHETLWSEKNVGPFAASLSDSLQKSEALELQKAG